MFQLNQYAAQTVPYSSLRAYQQLLPDTLICISLQAPAVRLLERQLTQDIKQKPAAKRPGFFSLFELMDMRQVLPESTANCVMSHRQRRLLAQYVYVQYTAASRRSDSLAAQLYTSLLDSFLPDQDTQITFTWLHFQRY